MTASRVPHALLTAATYTAHRSGLHGRLNQLPSPTWLTDVQVRECINHMRRAMKFVHHGCGPQEKIMHGGPMRHEMEVETDHIQDKNMWTLRGRLDAVESALSPEDKSNVWEFKCTAEITTTNKLQLALYQFLCTTGTAGTMGTTGDTGDTGGYRYLLFNFYDGMLLECKGTPHQLLRVVDMVLRAKRWGDMVEDDTDAFLSRSMDIMRSATGVTTGHR